MEAKVTYLHQTPTCIQKEIAYTEEWVKIDQYCTQDEEIEMNMGPWVSYLGSSQNWDTKYYTIVTLYWQIKSLIGKVLLEFQEERNEMLLQKTEIQYHVR